MAKYKNKEELEKRFIEELANEGEKIITQAYLTRDWRNRSYNLHDSYGSAVYKNGVLQKDTIRFVETTMANPRRNDKELGDWGHKAKNNRSRTMRGSEHREFLKTSSFDRMIKGDTVQAYGYDEITKFLKGYKATSEGLELVVFAAMFYAGILESGELGKKYRVISHVTSDFANFAKNLGKGVEAFVLEVKRNENQVTEHASFSVTKKTPITLS